MAIQILPRGATSGDVLQTGIGNSLAQVLGNVAHQRAQSLAMQDMVRRAQGLGLDEGSANYFSTLDPQNQLKFLEMIAPGLGRSVGAAQESPQRSAVQSIAQKGLSKEQAAQQKEANKETKKYYDNILGLKDAAEFAETRLNKMEKLIEKGNLPNPTAYRILKNIEEHAPSHAAGAAGALVGGVIGGPPGAAIGGGIGALLSPVATLLQSPQRTPDAEEFEKLSNDFVRDAKAIFGSRITDQDLKSFLATVPSLAQTNEGKKAIIRNMKMFNEAARIRYETAKQIIKDNGGQRPFDLPLLVEERSKDSLDKLSKRFASSAQ